MEAFLISTVQDPKVYVNDDFVTLSQEIKALGYDLEWMKEVTKPNSPILKDSAAYCTLQDLRDGINSASFVAIDSRLKDNDEFLYDLSLGILAAKRPEYGTYIIGPDNSDQKLIDDSLHQVASKFKKIIIDGMGNLSYSTDSSDSVGTNLETALGLGFEAIEISASVSQSNFNFAVLLGYAYATSADISYNPATASALIRVIIK